MDKYLKIFQAEKRLARGLIAVSHRGISSENRTARIFRNEIRKFLKNLKLVIGPEDIKNQARAIEKLTVSWRLQSSIIRQYLEKYLRDKLKVSYELNKIMLSGLLEVEEKAYKIKEAIASYDIEAAAVDYFLFRTWTRDGKNWLERVNDLSEGSTGTFAKIFGKGMKEGLGYYEILRQLKTEIAASSVAIEKIIRTEGQRIQNDILINIYERNKENLSGLEFTATLDTRTCNVCGAWDNKIFWYDEAPFVRNAPQIPIHPMCRCLYVPISKPWMSLGKRTRASKYGPTTGSYEDWLRGMEEDEPGFARDILKNKYSDWMSGEFSLDAKHVSLVPQVTVGDFLRAERYGN